MGRHLRRNTKRNVPEVRMDFVCALHMKFLWAGCDCHADHAGRVGVSVRDIHRHTGPCQRKLVHSLPSLRRIVEAPVIRLILVKRVIKAPIIHLRQPKVWKATSELKPPNSAPMMGLDAPNRRKASHPSLAHISPQGLRDLRARVSHDKIKGFEQVSNKPCVVERNARPQLSTGGRWNGL